MPKAVLMQVLEPVFLTHLLPWHERGVGEEGPEIPTVMDGIRMQRVFAVMQKCLQIPFKDY